MSHLLIKAFNPTASSEFVVFTYRKPIKKAGESEFIDHALFFDSVFLLENNTDLYTGFTGVAEAKSRYIKFTEYEKLRVQLLDQAANVRISEENLNLISKERNKFLRKCKIISGGQTGVDRGALEGARRAGLLTGGYAPKGYRTELGNDLSLVQLGLDEHFSYHYPLRTEQNIVDSDGTVIFTRGNRDPGIALTLKLLKEHGKPYIINPTKEELREFAKDKSIINVAGERESISPGIQQRVAKTIEEAFKEEDTDETENLKSIKQALNKPLSNRFVTSLQEELRGQLDSFWDNNRDLLEGLKYINLHRASEKLDFFRIILQYYLDGRKSPLLKLVIYDYFCEYHGECDVYNYRLSSIVKDDVNTLLKRIEKKEKANTFYLGQLKKLNELLRPFSEIEILDYFKQMRKRYITRQINTVSALVLPQNRQVVVDYLKGIVEDDKVVSSLIDTIRYVDDVETTDMESMAIHTINTIVTDLDNTAAKLNEDVDKRVLSEWIKFLEADPEQRRIIILSDANEGSLAVRVEPFIPKHLLSNFIFSEVGGNVTYYYGSTGQKVYLYDKNQIAEEMDKDSDTILEVLASVVGLDVFREDMSAEHISSFRKTFKLSDATKESWNAYVPRIKYELARRGLYDYSVYLSGRRTLRITPKNKRIVLKDLKNNFNLSKGKMLVLGDGGFKYHNDWYMWSYPRDAIKVNVGMTYSIPMFEGKNYMHIPDTSIEGTLATLRFLNEKDGSISIYDLLTHCSARFNKMVIFNGLAQSIKALQRNI
ncbi:MAG: hypothetical protein KJ706_10680 [Candidatus Omnitrophica bacterium]|nr:hypothetical protein [Candidatus Omnitrophota bacterium]